MAHARVAGIVPFFAGRTRPRAIRMTVLLCVVLICGSFAGAALLQMRNDRIHALAQARVFETDRAAGAAAAIGASFDRMAALGRDFADGKTVDGAANGITNITVYDASGLVLATQDSFASRAPPPDALSGATPRVLLPGTLVFAYGEKIVALDFDPRSVVPATLLTRAGLLLPDGKPLLHDAAWSGSGPQAAVPGWPVVVQTSVDANVALAAWVGSLPLYIFVILGPALAGGALAAVFVREFERRARAAQAIRALRSTRPVEAKLLVRLAQAERAAAEDARAKSEFIAHMSHELRTPLNAIIGFSEVIERGFYGTVGHAKYVEYAHDINEAGRALHGKIGDILEFANVEAGRYPITLASVDLSALAQAVVAEHAGRAFSRRIALEMGFALAANALADAQAVNRIVTSLIANALAYTQEGGMVRIDVRDEEAATVLRVIDNGHGFTREEAAKAGTPFRRFDRPGTETGAGMGLAIAMSLARRMGGAIRLDGTPGGGSVAELRLPKA
ncbi:MAG TPA: HAMP domain-containing sensor histidine kinase [Rhizomicrobium sp.]|nr:HAMP domain-containing sensor histidine kinase [Rhizomicrobium sp.]